MTDKVNNRSIRRCKNPKQKRRRDLLQYIYEHPYKSIKELEKETDNIHIRSDLSLLRKNNLVKREYGKRNSKYLAPDFNLEQIIKNPIIRDDLFDNKNYVNILLHIKNNSGISFTEIKNVFKLANGATQYFTGVLEDEGYITSKKIDKFRRFFMVEYNKPEFISRIKKNNTYTSKKEKLVKLVWDSPGLSQIEIAKKMNTTTQTINFHIKKLKEKEILKYKKIGKATYIYPIKENLISEYSDILFNLSQLDVKALQTIYESQELPLNKKELSERLDVNYFKLYDHLRKLNVLELIQSEKYVGNQTVLSLTETGYIYAKNKFE
jgi:predicted transcriptional regulator